MTNRQTGINVLKGLSKCASFVQALHAMHIKSGATLAGLRVTNPGRQFVPTSNVPGAIKASTLVKLGSLIKTSTIDSTLRTAIEELQKSNIPLTLGPEFAMRYWRQPQHLDVLGDPVAVTQLKSLFPGGIDDNDAYKFMVNNYPVVAKAMTDKLKTKKTKEGYNVLPMLKVLEMKMQSTRPEDQADVALLKKMLHIESEASDGVSTLPD